MGVRLALAAPVVCVVALFGCGDNHHPSEATLVLSPQTGLYTDEAGTAATFAVVLSEAPGTEVKVRISSMNAREGSISPSTLIFTDDNYMRAQTVTITGVDDKIADGDRPYKVRVATELFGSYDVDVINGDDDVAGVTITPLVGLMTTEGGGQATFSIALTSEPIAKVLVPVSSSDPGEGTVGITALEFSSANWSTPQTVTVTGAQDTAKDGNVSYAIVLDRLNSNDLSYDKMDPDDVAVLNVDDDVGGIAVTPTSGLTTSESGTTASFQVVLQTPPTGPVTIGVSSSNTGEANVSTAALVFTTGNWSQPQTVAISGQNDSIDDGDQPFTIQLAAAVSTDSEYGGVDPDDVTGTNLDDDTAGITVTPTSGLVTTEGGGSDTFTVKLDSQPTAPVVIAVSSSNTTEGVPVPTMLTFTTANWMTAQTVVVKGQNDTASDGNIAYTIQLATPTTTDATYAAIDPADVSCTNEDNDIPGFTFDPAGDLLVSEFQDSDQFAVTLNTPPTADVTIAFKSLNENEGIVMPASLTFTPLNWDVPQFVLLTGVNDLVADGNQNFLVETGPVTSADPVYNGINPPDITATCIDNDTSQVYVKAKKKMMVSENLTSTTFRVRLTIAPTATVTCTLDSNDKTEGTVSPTTLTFQPNNYGFRTVTITGVDDKIVDGDVSFAIVLNACTSTDLQYNGVNPFDVAVVNRDND